jgi:hypothetical protein
LRQERQEAVLVAVDHQLLRDLGAHHAHRAADVPHGGAEQRVDRAVELPGLGLGAALGHAARHDEVGRVELLEQARQALGPDLGVGREREDDVAGGVAEAHGERGCHPERGREGEDLDRLTGVAQGAQGLARPRLRAVQDVDELDRLAQGTQRLPVAAVGGAHVFDVDVDRYDRGDQLDAHAFMPCSVRCRRRAAAPTSRGRAGTGAWRYRR